MAAIEDLVQAAMQGGKPGPAAGSQLGQGASAGLFEQPASGQARTQQAPPQPQAMPAPGDIMPPAAAPQEGTPAGLSPALGMAQPLQAGGQAQGLEAASPLEPAEREDAGVIQKALEGDKPRWHRALNRQAAGKLAGGV
jgi:hypothetical protein